MALIKSKAIGRYMLKKYHPDTSLKPLVKNLDEAKSLGLIFAAHNEKEFRLATEYLKIIKEEYGIMNVRAFGYYPYKDELPFLKRTVQVDYFTKKDLNSYYKPEGKYINDFLKEKFDVLIDLSENDLLPLQFILRMSKARFKVGRYSEKNLPFYDLMIDVKNKSLAYYIEQVTIYLTTINKKISYESL